MSRSKKKPIYKTGPKNHNRAAIYWRTVRRVINTKVRYYQEEVDNVILPVPQEVVNDYDYIDYIWDARFLSRDASENLKKLSKRLGRK